jgi:cytochrome c2
MDSPRGEFAGIRGGALNRPLDRAERRRRKDAKNRVVPELNGIVGRPVASAPDFRYCDAFLASGKEGLVRIEENLDADVTNPRRSSLGTR